MCRGIVRACLVILRDGEVLTALWYDGVVSVDGSLQQDTSDQSVGVVVVRKGEESSAVDSAVGVETPPASPSFFSPAADAIGWPEARGGGPGEVLEPGRFYCKEAHGGYTAGLPDSGPALNPISPSAFLAGIDNDSGRIDSMLSTATDMNVLIDVPGAQWRHGRLLAFCEGHGP